MKLDQQRTPLGNPSRISQDTIIVLIKVGKTGVIQALKLCCCASVQKYKLMIISKQLRFDSSFYNKAETTCILANHNDYQYQSPPQLSRNQYQPKQK
jgi:hypothetical protein